MASNRDPRKDYRINRRGRKVTSSADRSKRAKKASAPRPTSSATRANRRGSGVKKVTEGKGKKVEVRRNLTLGGDTGRRGGTNQPAKAGPKTTGRPKVSKVGPQLRKASGGMKTSSNNLRARGTAALAGALSTGSIRRPVSKARQKEASRSIGKYNTREADMTIVSRAKVGPKKVGPKKVGTVAEAFDRAFAAAKKAGKKTFTFKGKKYNTKTA